MADCVMFKSWAISHTHFRFKKKIKNFHPGGVAKNLKELRQFKKDFLFWHCLVYLFHNVLMHEQKFTARRCLMVRHISNTLSYDHLFIYYKKSFPLSTAKEKLFYFFTAVHHFPPFTYSITEDNIPVVSNNNFSLSMNLR